MAEEISFSEGDILSIDQAMQLAIQVAKQGAPFVSPNPLVGCVVLSSDFKLMASGYHKKYGTDHAEVDALKQLSSDQIQNSIFVVTLEPCAHEGKTPSCAKTLSKLPLQKVIYGLIDPNPLVSGQGAAILKAAGIQADEYQGVLKNKLYDLAEVFLKNYNSKKTFVALKVATSLDGQIALKTGESQWITTEKSREKVHELRSWYDAILVGRNTIVTDNPSLNVRHPFIQKENIIIIIDPQGTLLKQIQEGRDFKFLKIHSKENIIFAVQKKMDSSFTTVLFQDLNDLLNQLFKLKIYSIFIEGGAKTYSEFIKNNLVDRYYVFMNMSLIGSQNGLSWTQNFSISQLKEKTELKIDEQQLFGQDLFLSLKNN